MARLQYCVDEVNLFLNTSLNGIDRGKQFECVSELHWKIWTSAIDKWGFPKVKNIALENHVRLEGASVEPSTRFA